MIEVLKQALKAFEVATTPLAKDRQEVLEAVKAIKQAIAELESQEPVAWISPKGHIHFDPYLDSVPLYTHPPQEQRSCDKRTWVDLTPKDLNEIFELALTGEGAVYRALAKFKEKNT
jgi:hypothetical protein